MFFLKGSEVNELTGNLEAGVVKVYLCNDGHNDTRMG